MAHSHDNTKERTFSHLTPYDRGRIGALRNEGKTLQEIADGIGCNRSTISRELKRGTVTQRKSDLTEYQVFPRNRTSYLREASFALWQEVQTRASHCLYPFRCGKDATGPLVP